MGRSLLMTLACKHKSTVNRMIQKYKSTEETPYGPMQCYKVIIPRKGKNPLIARFGAEPLRRDRDAALRDERPHMAPYAGTTELVQRLLADQCECCGTTGDVEVHHIRKLADLTKPGRQTKPDWQRIMSQRRRKTLILCTRCHDDLHAGKPMRWSSSNGATGEPDEAKVSSPVRRGADGKGDQR
jgi:hypothetical protein